MAPRTPPLLPALPGEPQHTRAARTLRDAVQRGDLPPAERLGARSLARAWSMGRATVQDALDQLQAEGYLEVRPQSGTYVASGPFAAAASTPVRHPPAVPLSSWAVRALSGQRADAPAQYQVDFRIGQPAGLFPSGLWAEALARQAEQLAQLTLDAGELGPLHTRRAIAGWLSRERGAQVTPDMVMLTGGTQSALDLLGRTWLEPGRTAVVEDPCYPGARRAFAATGAALVPAGVDAQGLDPAGLPASASLLYLTPGCQFPTTATLSASRRAQLLQWAEAAGAFIIEDDYAADFHHTARPPAPLQAQAPQQVILLGTFSQSLAPALRSGYLVAPPEVLDVLARTRPLTDRHPPTLDALALADFLTSGGYGRHLRRARTQLAHRAEVLEAALHAELPQLSSRPVRAGLHLYLPLPATQQETEVQDRAAAMGVGVSGVAEYSVNAQPPALLLAFAHLTPEQLREGVRLLKRVLG
ncbi:PLP-dependent aminotransferase family protein [Deinococcus sonorensis]|uniref:PLP-dependent aminotransferase family protein n=2 Tax=Deinococcus sonorensis TaxID=309891 RepID=A0AAU7U996_9DEIO